MLDYLTLKQEVIGKWPGIFDALGIVVPDGERKHGPCPLCGGKDRFRMDDKEGKGTYICGQCGAGDGWELVRKSLGCGFKEAAKSVSDVLGIIEVAPLQPKAEKDPKERLNALWSASVPLTTGDPVMRYLNARGIKTIPQSVRYCASCWEPDTKKNYPAMIAMVSDSTGKPVTLHRTYLDGTGKAKIESPKKLMTGIAKLQGVAIRLMPASETLGIAEGIETALSAAERFRVPVWAAVNSGILESFIPPEGVKGVIVFGDNDENFTGQKAAYKLANSLFIKGYCVRVNIPEKGDWNEEAKCQA